MASLKDYFEKRDAGKPAPKWVSGDRISGKVLNGVTVIGSVIREDYTDPKQVLCHLDLPVKVGHSYRSVVFVPSKSMKRLRVL